MGTREMEGARGEARNRASTCAWEHTKSTDYKPLTEVQVTAKITMQSTFCYAAYNPCCGINSNWPVVAPERCAVLGG